MLSQKRIDALAEQAKVEGIIGDIETVLSRAITVGEMMEFLKKFSPETPVEVEVPVEFDENGEMVSEVGFVIDIFKSPGMNKNAEVITFRALKPDLVEEYDSWEEELESEDTED